MVGAVGAAIGGTMFLDPVPDDMAVAVLAPGSELLDCALKTVEIVAAPFVLYRKHPVIVISAYDASGHGSLTC